MTRFVTALKQVTAPNPATIAVPMASPVLCRFGASCTRPDCSFTHPARAALQVTQFATPCRFGVACTRADCSFTHPPGRVVPNAFNRGHHNSSKGSAGILTGPSPNMSIKFKNPATSADVIKEKLQAQMKELEAQKEQIAAREAAATPNKTTEPT